jgi:large subunit ribosomal protein L33
MAKKNKGNRIQVILECTESRNTNAPGISRYVTTKNRKNTPGRIELMKYNKFLKRHTLHREVK